MTDGALQQHDGFLIALSGDQERRFDRRLGIGLANGLDALQNR